MSYGQVQSVQTGKSERQMGSVISSLERAERTAASLTEEVTILKERMEGILSQPPEKTPGQSLNAAGLVCPSGPNECPLSVRIDGLHMTLESLRYQISSLRTRLEV